jgi:hypothetical protein
LNRSVELHDSTIAAVEMHGTDAVVRFAPAYVHRSAGSPGVDPGSGWLQDLDLIVCEATIVSRPSNLPCDISDGSLAVGEVLWDNSIPLPIAGAGPVSLSAVTTAGASLLIQGSRAEVVLRGEARYLEKFPGSDEV